MGAAEAERVLKVTLAQADADVSLRNREGREATRALTAMLKRANAELERRLRREARRYGPEERFTGVGLLAYQRQVQLAILFAQNRLRRISAAQTRQAIRRGWFGTVDTLRRLEEAFTGSVRPLQIDSARMMDARTRGVKSSLLAQRVTSVDRYGEKLIAETMETLQTNMLVGGTFTDAVDALVAGRGPRGIVSKRAVVMPDGTVRRISLERIPEGLFRRYRYWAMRIVRTEVAYAQNGAAFEAIGASRDTDFPDMQKKILAMMDNRTAPDSIAVHGQIRDVGQPFMDGAGRSYLHPPARPNDREVVIPWRPHWTNTRTSRPQPARTRDRAADEASRAPSIARASPVRFGPPTRTG